MFLCSFSLIREKEALTYALVTFINFQKLALSASGANAMGLGMGMGVGGVFPGLGGGMMPTMIPSGAPVVPSEVTTKVVCLTQVSTL